ncbi:MAG TPA: DUF3466 family protein [Bryobacteraceae bacterium]|jgi:probable HAF family extracellular repeat protein|nr:DUF3466 family protein [Bryobacteraceae bacterium]
MKSKCIPSESGTSAPSALLPLIFVLLATGCASQALAADITAIPTPSYASTYANGINDLGQVVGGVVAPSHFPCGPTDYVCGGPVGTPFIYSHGRVTYEGTGCSHDCLDAFTGINNSGEIAGTISSDYYHLGRRTVTMGYLFAGGRRTYMPVISSPGPAGIDYVNSGAAAVNSSGMVVGSSEYLESGDDSPRHAVFYSAGKTTDIGDLTGSGYTQKQSFGNAINDRGQIAGMSDTTSGAQHAFLYSNGKMSDLGSLGGNSAALGINDAGEIIGDSFLADGSQHAFLKGKGGMVDLGTLGGTYSRAKGINANGEIVGNSSLQNTQQDAFLYLNGAMIDLNSLLPDNSGWQLEDATAINNNGVIVGDGTYNGQERAFILYTTPEPAPVALLGMGIVCLGLIRRRSNRHSS